MNYKFKKPTGFFQSAFEILEIIYRKYPIYFFNFPSYNVYN